MRPFAVASQWELEMARREKAHRTNQCEQQQRKLFDSNCW